jgi:hypothetical protein
VHHPLSRPVWRFQGARLSNIRCSVARAAAGVSVRKGVVAMKADQKVWLETNSVTCRVFKGRWSIRHCLKMYHDMRDLKIQMSTRGKGKVTRFESSYNPCEHCGILTRYVDSLAADRQSECGCTPEACYSDVVGL